MSFRSVFLVFVFVLLSQFSLAGVSSTIPLCSETDLNLVTPGFRCKVSGNKSGGFDYHTQTQIEFVGTESNPIYVKRVYHSPTNELGWLDETSGTIYLDYEKNSNVGDGQNYNINYEFALYYCNIKQDGKFVRELPNRDDFLSLERHGLREVLNFNRSDRQFWSSTIIPGQIQSMDTAHVFYGVVGSVTTDYTRSFYGAARCIAR